MVAVTGNVTGKDKSGIVADTYLTKSQLYGTSTARPRRSRKLGAKLKGNTSQSHAESRFFEDSTDGVASILKRKLQQLEVTEAYQASSEDDSGHTSDVGTQCEDEDLDASHTSDVGTQYGDEDVDAGRHTSDVRTQRGDGGDLGGVVEPVESSGKLSRYMPKNEIFGHREEIVNLLVENKN